MGAPLPVPPPPPSCCYVHHLGYLQRGCLYREGGRRVWGAEGTMGGPRGMGGGPKGGVGEGTLRGLWYPKGKSWLSMEGYRCVPNAE